MSAIRITWKDPAVRSDGVPLDVSELARIDVSMRVAGAPEFTIIAAVAPGVQSFTQTDLPPGDYEFSLVAVDTQTPSRSSVGVVVAVNIPVPVLAAPGDVTDVLATVID
jgi:hypothetical protein